MSDEESTTPTPPKEAEHAEARRAPLSGHEILRRYSVLTEYSLTLSKLLLLFTAFLTVFLSYLAGAEPVWIVARGVIATFSMGLTLWVANWFFTQRVMETVMADAKQAEEQAAPEPAPVSSTVEKRA